MLQLKSDTPLAEISKLINDLKSEIENQQLIADDSWEKSQVDCQTKLEDYSQRIVRSSAEIEEAEFNIKKLAQDLSDLQKIIDNKTQQIKILLDKETLIQDLRSQDKEDYEKKIAQISEILSAMNLILSKLQAVSPEDQSNIDDELVKLSEIGKANPINSFVHFTMTFDQETLDEILTKLQKIQKSLEEALDEEKVFEDNAESNCQVLLNEIAITKKNLQDDLKTHKAQNNEVQANKKAQETRRDQNKEELENCLKGKSQWTLQCEEFQKNYSGNTNQRFNKRFCLF